MISGIDVSASQGEIEFSKVLEAGFRFCICKATEGVDFIDRRFVSNLRDIAALDGALLPGAYHFARPDHRAGRSGGEAEAKWFCKSLLDAAKSAGLSLQRGFLEPVLDMEKYDESDASDNIAWVEGFLSVVAGELGRKGMIYTGPNYWRYQVGDTERFAAAGVPLWQVRYSKQGAAPDGAPPRIPTDDAKTQWTPSLWQWSGGGDFAHYRALFGDIPGVPSGIADVSRVMGDESLLDTLAAASHDDSPRSSEPSDTSKTSTAATLDLRDRRGTTSSTTARVQGLLLSQGYGPEGLISARTGRPDGISGSATENALSSFKKSVALPADTIVDAATWRKLVRDGLD